MQDTRPRAHSLPLNTAGSNGPSRGPGKALLALTDSRLLPNSTPGARHAQQRIPRKRKTSPWCPSRVRYVNAHLSLSLQLLRSVFPALLSVHAPELVLTGVRPSVSRPRTIPPFPPPQSGTVPRSLPALPCLPSHYVTQTVLVCVAPPLPSLPQDGKAL